MIFLAGLIAVAILAVFISAIPISYEVEAQSNPERFGDKRFGFTNIWAVALGIGVARDEATQALRRAVLMRLGIAAVLFAFLIVSFINR